MKKTGPKTLNTRDRFYRHVDVLLENDCWLWRGYKLKTGYGIFVMNPSRNEKNKTTTAHRAAWIISNGDIQQGIDVCHSCDNPACVNLNHLWLGTPKENTQDMVKKGRHNPGHVPGEKNGQVKLKKSDVEKLRGFYVSGQYSHRQLASFFDMSKTQIGRILRNESWKEVG